MSLPTKPCKCGGKVFYRADSFRVHRMYELGNIGSGADEIVGTRTGKIWYCLGCNAAISKAEVED